MQWWANRVDKAKEDGIQIATLATGAKQSVLRYTEASIVQMYKIVACKCGLATIYIVLKTEHTEDDQNYWHLTKEDIKPLSKF